ncbi:MAG: tetratricopeptide repeat protein [Candidatus Zixiibacteriota bacterium]|nr:MAG: tetratricopeptide repeat protein [candidate division Zixibacteria bacterium]
MIIESAVKISGIFFLIILIAAVAVSAQTVEDFIVNGDSLYELYDYEGSIEKYRTACLLDSNSFEAFWKLGRSLNLKGETVERDSRLAIFEEARDVENRALSLDENHADAHFQLARALGKIALFKGVFKSASLARQVRDECRRALEIDSLHDGAWHILGRWHREVGKKPKILRIPMGLGAANKKDALAFMQKALEINPENINHRLEMGNTYCRYRMYDLARSEYRRCLDMVALGPLDKKYQGEAKKSLAEMDKN